MSEKMADDFLMSPMVDYCFKELLAYPTVRKGFLAAILNRDPSEIGSTELLPTILEKEVYRSFGNLCAGTEETSAGAVEGANDHPVDAVSFGAEEGGL